MVVAENAARSLHHAAAVALRVVRLALAEGDTLGHCCSANNIRTDIRDKIKVPAYRLKGRLVKGSVYDQRFGERNDVQRVLRGAGADELEKLDDVRESQTRRSHARHSPYVTCNSSQASFPTVPCSSRDDDLTVVGFAQYICLREAAVELNHLSHSLETYCAAYARTAPWIRATRHLKIGLSVLLRSLGIQYSDPHT